MQIRVGGVVVATLLPRPAREVVKMEQQDEATGPANVVQLRDAVPFLDRDAKAIEDITATMKKVCDYVGHPDVYRALAEAAVLHGKKNKGYRSTSDPLANFNNARPVRNHQMTVRQYTHTLMEKQDDALCSLVWADPATFAEKGGEEMFRERALDGIVYRAILLAEGNGG